MWHRPAVDAAIESLIAENGLPPPEEMMKQQEDGVLPEMSVEFEVQAPSSTRPTSRLNFKAEKLISVMFIVNETGYVDVDFGYVPVLDKAAKIIQRRFKKYHRQKTMKQERAAQTIQVKYKYFAKKRASKFFKNRGTIGSST